MEERLSQYRSIGNGMNCGWTEYNQIECIQNPDAGLLCLHKLANNPLHAYVILENVAHVDMADVLICSPRICGMWPMLMRRPMWMGLMQMWPINSPVGHSQG